jgi:hypothetical protein
MGELPPRHRVHGTEVIGGGRPAPLDANRSSVTEINPASLRALTYQTAHKAFNRNQDAPELALRLLAQIGRCGFARRGGLDRHSLGNVTQRFSPQHQIDVPIDSSARSTAHDALSFRAWLRIG